MTGFKFKVKETRLNLCFEELGNSRKGQSSEAVLPPGLRQGKFISSCFHTSSATSSANFWPQYLNNGISIKAAWDRLLLCFCFTGNVLHLSVCTLCFLSSHTNLSLIPRIGQPLNAPLGLVLNHFKDFCQVTEDSSLFVCPNKLTIFWRNECLTYKVVRGGNFSSPQGLWQTKCHISSGANTWSRSPLFGWDVFCYQCQCSLPFFL